MPQGPQVSAAHLCQLALDLLASLLMPSVLCRLQLPARHKGKAGFPECCQVWDRAAPNTNKAGTCCT